MEFRPWMPPRAPEPSHYSSLPVGTGASWAVIGRVPHRIRGGAGGDMYLSAPSWRMWYLDRWQEQLRFRTPPGWWPQRGPAGQQAQ